MKVISYMTKGMVMVYCTSKMEVIMMESGKMTKCMGLVNFITRMDLLLMKVTGKTISSMVKGEYTIWSLLIFHKSSTIRIFHSLEISGHIMMVSSRMIQSMERDI